MPYVSNFKIASYVANELDRLHTEVTTISFPCEKYQNDPIGFVRDILGKEPWQGQIEILESVMCHRNTTVRSGHKCGKTAVVSWIATWFYCSFPDARVFITAVKRDQLQNVLYREIKKTIRQAKIPEHLFGKLNETVVSGLKSTNDERQIFGGTSKTGEGLAGISGANVLVIVDEASGVSDKFFETLGSTLAGSGGIARKVYISNPTRTSGEFFDSHNKNSSNFNCIHISSEETPNALRLKRDDGSDWIFPGLAGPDWIEERKREYGEESYAYKVRVKGEFVHDLDGKIISGQLIADAQHEWELAIEEGPLQLGIDPAGDGIAGDESAIAVRRGNKVLGVYTWRGITEDDIVVHAVALLRKFRKKTDRLPRIAVDIEGGIGTRVQGKLYIHLESSPYEFELIGVKSSHKAYGSPEYHLVRDHLWGNLATWIKAGGKLPEDEKLALDLNAPWFVADDAKRYRATPKDELRKILGRSPDRGDAVCLSVWGFEAQNWDEQPSAERNEVTNKILPANSAHIDYVEQNPGFIDYYAGISIWQR